MRHFPIALALACAAAFPAFAQLHENGVARSGTVARTQTGGTAFMCRLACSLDGGCGGWNWTRAGEDGPQSRCEILTGAITANPDTCCASGAGEGGGFAAAAPVSAGNQYAGRSREPNGPPVELVSDVPAGLLTEDLQLQQMAEDEAEAEAAGENGGDAFAEADEEDFEEGPQASTLTQEDVPTPTGRITSVRRSGAGGRPRYSVQQEYGGTATAPEQAAPPAGMTNPNRWLGG